MTTADAIQERFGDESMVGAIVIVADIFAANEKGEAINPIVAVCNDPRQWVQAALLCEGLARAEEANDKRQDAVEADNVARGYGDDDDDED